ncbi:UNVERIFIED_CONTAM: putative LRR receptor-like serine/threonine-protein kinase RFK1, partial [Sesamum calycinum]
MHPRKTVVFCVLAVCCLGLLRLSESQVPQEEVDALQQIVTDMGATYWSFDADLCEVEMVGISPAAPSGSEGYVECNCNYNNNSVCHVTKIVIKSYNLPGILPPGIVKLPYLRDISVLVNRLSGEIPKELGNITSLTYLNLEANQFSGAVPADIGRILRNCNITGEIPPYVWRLRVLQMLDVSFNRLVGEIPNHIARNLKLVGYMAPEYALWGYLTDKADVYSFGVVLLEIVSGKSNNNYMPSHNFICLLDWANHLQESKKIDELIDERLVSRADIEEIDRVVRVALLCTNATPSIRPTMSEVVQMLEGKMAIPDVITVGSPYNNDVRFKAVKDFHQERRIQSATWSQSQNSTTIRTDAASTVLARVAISLRRKVENALHEVAVQLGKKDWDFNLNPCDGNSNWTTPKRYDMPWYNNSVICNCSYPGERPDSQLPQWYYPTGMGIDKLEYMSVTVNRLSGPLPEYLGNITTLVYMGLESNLFNGMVPAELGKLTNLENLILSANNLTGELPMELNNLKKLTELRLSSNFIGKIPSLRSWTNLQMLELQASGFEGPIPSSISVLKNLSELRISDLNGGASEFPLLKDMLKMNNFQVFNLEITLRVSGIPYFSVSANSMHMLQERDRDIWELGKCLKTQKGDIILQVIELNIIAYASVM